MEAAYHLQCGGLPEASWLGFWALVFRVLGLGEQAPQGYEPNPKLKSPRVQDLDRLWKH